MLTPEGAVVQIDAPAYRCEDLANESAAGLPHPHPPDEAIVELRRPMTHVILATVLGHPAYASVPPEPSIATQAVTAPVVNAVCGPSCDHFRMTQEANVTISDGAQPWSAVEGMSVFRLCCGTAEPSGGAWLTSPRYLGRGG